MQGQIQTISTLHQLLDYDAGRFINAETQLKNQLPAWIGQATTVKLKTILQKYLEVVDEHIRKLNDFLQEEQVTAASISHRVMHAFLEDSQEKLSLCSDPEVKDATLLASVQLINHYKISLYGTAAAFAKALEMEKASSVFHEAEVNEKQIDDRLSQLATFEINKRAKTPIVLPG